jgi:hypothetical protein
MLRILDFIFVIYFMLIIWAAGAQLVSGNIIDAMKNAVMGMLSLVFFVRVLGVPIQNLIRIKNT